MITGLLVYSVKGRAKVNKIWFQDVYLKFVFLLFGCVLLSSVSTAQQYKADFTSSPVLSAGYWAGWNTHATVNLGGVDYTIIIGQVTNWGHYSTGGESNSGSISATGGGDVTVTISRKDGQRFQFYEAWLKYTNYASYTNQDLKVTYSGSSEPQQIFARNSTVILTKDVNVTSVSLYFGGLDRIYLDNLIVGPAKASLPSLTTSAASNIGGTTVAIGGKITSDGGGTITERGVVWSASNTVPAITDSKLNMVSGSGTFSGQISGLSKSTTYYARAYAINSAGTAYGSVVTFTTTDGTGAVTLNPTMDTSIDNLDKYPFEAVCYVGYFDPTYGAGQAVVKFDFSGVEGTVQSAKFRINVSGITNAASTVPVAVWGSSDDSWTESTSTVPAKLSPALVSSTVPALGWMEFDVTDFIVSEGSGNKIATLIITGSSSSQGYSDFFFNSRENSTNKPELVLTMGASNAAPTVSAAISNISVLENAANSTISLQNFFSDTEDGAAGLTYSVQSTDPTYFSTSIGAGNVLNIDYAATGIGGPATVKVRATDSQGAYIEQSFTVTVSGSSVSYAISGDESFNEGNSGTSTKTFTITKTGSTNFSSQLKFTFSGTATNNTDYKNIGGTAGAISTSGTISFGANETSKTITVDVIGNSFYEDDKSIVVTLSEASTSGSGNASITTSSATKTIKNDDLPPTVTLATNKSSIAESGGVAEITATLNVLSKKDVTVNLAISGTATGGGTDYTLADKIIVPAGQLSAGISLTSVEDAIYEGDETVIIDFSSVVNGTKNGTAQTVTLIDDDQIPSVTLSLTGSPMAENGGIATVTATLSAASGKETVVQLAFSGTASGGGVDYNVSSSSITIPVGSTTGTITLTAVDDATAESNETIVVSIASVTNGVEAGSQEVIAVITDDDKQSQTITFTGIGSKTYGNQAVNLSATATSGKAVRFESSNPSVATVSGSALTIISAGSVTIKAIQDGDDSYQSAESEQTITISKATLTVTAEDKSKVYGEANPALTVTYAGFVNGDDAADLTTAPTASTTAVATSGAGVVAITVAGGSAANYNFSYVAGELTISKATLTVTADDKSKVYGEANPALTVAYTGFVNGDDKTHLATAPTAGTTADAATGAGTHAITASGGSDANYNFSYVTGELTISKATLTVTAEDKSKVYGESNPALTVAYTGFVNEDDESDLTTAPTAGTTADAASGAGTYAITVSGGSDANYNFSYVAGELTISKATLTVTAEDKSKVYGEANPALTITYAGFANGDDSADLTTAPTASTTADATTGAGAVAITVAGGTDGNYNFSYVAGELTISKATLTVTAEDKSKVYGETNPALTVTYSGFVNGDDKGDLTTAPTATTTADATTGVGTVSIAVAGGADSNYAFNYVVGELTINKATVTVTAEDKGKVYGEANPALTLSYAGFVNGDGASDLDTAPVAFTTADASTGAGVVAITVSGGTDDNYDFGYVAGELTISKATLTVIAEDKSKEYGEQNPSFSVSYAGFVNGEDENDLHTVPVVATAANGTSSVDAYEITVSGGSDENYDFTYTAGTLTINKATLTVSADDKQKIYGEGNPDLTIIYEGFKNADNEQVLDIQPIATTPATATSGVGAYPITPDGGQDENYQFQYAPGTLTVGKATLTVTADNQRRAFTEAHPEFTVQYSGFVNNEGVEVLNVRPVAATTANEGSPVGAYPITVGGGAGSNYAFTYGEGVLTIYNNAPALAASLQDQVATEDVVFQFTFNADVFAEGDPGDRLTYSATLANGNALPSWISFHAESRTFSGTPTNADVGSIEVLVKATDKAGDSATDVFGLQVVNVNDAPVVAVQIPDQRAYKNQPFQYTVAAGSFIDVDVDDVLTYTAALSNGNPLPEWLSFDAATQTFSGTPALTDKGSLTIVVTAKDQSNASATDEFVLLVTDPNQVPVNISLSATEVEENQAPGTLIGTFSTEDADVDNVHTYRLVSGEGSADNHLFYIEGNKLYTASSFDAETKAGYSIRVETNDGDDGKLEKVFQISIIDVEDVRVFIPNLFSPNGDGSNDSFMVLANGVAEVSFRIFNRWGEMMYETTNVEQATSVGWDGTFKGKAMPSGSYVWQLSGKFTDGKAMDFKGKNTGNITLVR